MDAGYAREICVYLVFYTFCQAILHEQEIRHCIGEQRSNWEKRLSSKIQTSFDMIPCAFPNCGASYFREDIGDSVSFTCRECRQSTCVACQTLVHPGRTCTENMTMKDEDLGLGVQRCPSCRSRAVKEGDECDRVLCLQCHAAFCAKCSAPYDGPFGLRQTDNSAHEPTCSNYFEPEKGKPPVYTLRRASQHKSNAKSESPPPSMRTVLWTVIAEDVKYDRHTPFVKSMICCSTRMLFTGKYLKTRSPTPLQL